MTLEKESKRIKVANYKKRKRKENMNENKKQQQRISCLLRLCTHKKCDRNSVWKLLFFHRVWSDESKRISRKMRRTKQNKISLVHTSNNIILNREQVKGRVLPLQFLSSPAGNMKYD